MKATGIVRRIDDLGRIVIPKEIRRTLRIREGDPLEIYTDQEGKIIFKKYSAIGEIALLDTQYAEVLYKMCSLPTLISDRDQIVATSGVLKKDYLKQQITQEVRDLLETRQNLLVLEGNIAQKIKPVDGSNQSALIIQPILVNGDIAGSVIMLETEKKEYASPIENKLAQAAALFLSKQME